MVNNLIALATVLTFIGLVSVLYNVLVSAVSRKALKPFIACIILWPSIALAPKLILWLAIPVGNFVYVTFPSLKVAAWDVGLALTLWIGMYVSYAIGVIVALGAPFTFFEKAHQNKAVNNINE